MTQTLSTKASCRKTIRVILLIVKTLFVLKPKAIIAGLMENQAARFFFIRFSIDNSIANTRLYALSCPKFNFGYYLTFEIIF